MRASAYNTLGVARGCSDAEVLWAWRVLGRSNHPDARRFDADFDEAAANARFLELSEAYHTLRTQRDRNLHLKWMRLFCSPCGACSAAGLRARLGRPPVPCATCGGAGYLDK